MLSNRLKFTCAVLACGALAAAQVGCACGTAKGSCVTTRTTKAPCDTPRALCDREYGEISASLPSNARPGECYAKVFIPPTFKTVTERVMVRDASETIEIVPAQYAWAEERVLVKDASTQLEVVPAEFDTRERTVQINSGYTDWEINKNLDCDLPKEQPARDVFCLVNHPAENRTIPTQVVVKPAQVKTVCIPAQYETVRRQKLVSPATTRKICTPAQYENIEKTVKVCDGRMGWKLVDCAKPGAEIVTINSDRTINTDRTTYTDRTTSIAKVDSERTNRE